MNENTLWAEILMEELFRAGARTAVVSPGSRSTPLALALGAHPGFQVYSQVDERSGGFFALGHAKAGGQPVVLVCTSGTAAANYYPAVIEAYHARVPLIVLTADRPYELRDTGAEQTIDQPRMFGTAVKGRFDLDAPRPQPHLIRHLRATAARAAALAAETPAGPVHLNLPFRKPLEPMAPPPGHPAALPLDLEPQDPLAFHGKPHRTPWAVVHPAGPEPDRNAVQLTAQGMANNPRGVVLCGPLMELNGHGETAQAVARMARLARWPVAAEPPAGLRHGPWAMGTEILAHPEALLRQPGFRSRWVPQVVLRIGPPPTAPHLERWLTANPQTQLVVVNNQGGWPEPTHHPMVMIQADPALFCLRVAEQLEDMADTITRDPAWLDGFVQADRTVEDALNRLWHQPGPDGLADGWFEGRVFRELTQVLPKGAVVFTANSMPVRDLDAFTPKTAQPLRHMVSRGANGIDGTLSTALGAAARLSSDRQPVVLVTGDLAFLHDAGGLLAAKRYHIPLTVVLVNNDGGGIFDMLPVAELPGRAQVFQHLFTTPHGLDFSALAKAYGSPHAHPTHWEDFRREVETSVRLNQQGEGGTRIIEISTDRQDSHRRRKLAWSAAAQALVKHHLADA
ncbi:MAG: 2-succinyl-5-enolpyruvyl-6-hydroxy-3-cyclohexene-1-carboxylic-acid synthase [Deltaproteobacteria bacterium]|nr:2-succinyl-5-enolpyruvyl-6-hydroxy-3-cyclohexene-1-carboxylic-acid synthase [Deltaproteobacteria bacterium]